MKNNFKVQLVEALKRRQEVRKDVSVIPTPEQMKQKRIEEMLMFNVHYGMYNTAQK